MTSRSSWLLRLAFSGLATAVLAIGVACGGDDGDSGKDSTAPSATASLEGSGNATSDNGGADGNGAAASAEIEGYFAEIEALFQEADSNTAELQTLFDEAMTAAQTLDEEKQALVGFIFDSSNILTKALDDLEGINAPSEAEDEHAAFIEAGRNVIALSTDFADQIGAAETEADIDAINTQFDEQGTAAAAAADQACADLQAVADGYNVVIDLNCDD